jgi:hypothetical protein
MTDQDDVQKVSVGDKEYSLDELNELVGYGNKYQEFKEKYDTDPDKAWSAYGRVTQQNKELSAKAEEAEQLRAEIEKLKSNSRNVTDDGDLTPEAKAQAKAAARKLDLLTKDDIADVLNEMGYVKKNDIDNAFTSRKIMSQFEDLQDKFTGKDGRPKFDQDEMVAYMERTRMTDPELAYKTKYADELAEFRAQRIIEEKYPQLVTSRKGAEDKKPKVPAITSENLAERIREKLYPGTFQ